MPTGTPKDVTAKLNSELVRILNTQEVKDRFAGLGVDNVLVELNGPEVPIMDGSAAPFVYLINEAGIKTQPEARLYLKILGRSRWPAATSASRSTRRSTSRSPTASATTIRCCGTSRGRFGFQKRRSWTRSPLPARSRSSRTWR